MIPHIAPVASSEVAGATARELVRQAQETSVPNEPKAAAPTVDEEEVRKAIASTGDQIVVGGRAVQFSYDKSAHRVIVTVRSTETGEVIRQIPPDEYLKFAARLREMVGVLLDDQF